MATRDYKGSPTLAVSLNSSDLLRIADKFRLSSIQLRKAVADAVNDTAYRGRGLTRKRIRSFVTLRASRVNAAVEISAKATQENPTAAISLDRHARNQPLRPSLISYGGKPTKPPYESASAARRRSRGRKARTTPFSYQILKSGPRLVLPGGFVARANKRGSFWGGRGAPAVPLEPGTGSVQAFRRVGKARYPLVAPKGPSIAALWQNEQTGIAADTLKDLRTLLPQRVQGQARRIYDSQFKGKPT